MIMATREVEVVENIIHHHKTTALMMNGYRITGRPYKDDAYNPYSDKIYIARNHIDQAGFSPSAGSSEGSLVLLEQIKKVLSNEEFPNVIFDGDTPENSSGRPPVCFDNNTPFSLINLNFRGTFGDPSRDPRPFFCEMTPLPPVQLRSF